MIPGETEQLIAARYDDEAYDNFLFFGSKEKRKQRKDKRRKKRELRKIARASKPKKAFSDTLVGQTIAGLGGAQGIGQTIDMFTGNRAATQTDPSLPEEDFEMRFGTDNDPKKKEIPIAVYIAGSVVLLMAVAIISRKKRPTP